MDSERDVELHELPRVPWSAPVLRLLSAVAAEASEGPLTDSLGTS